MAELRNVEILKVGTWNRTPITSADLDEIVKNFKEVGYKPPIKLGHSDDPGERAYGWVTRVWREGERLLADFADIPDKVFEAIRDHGYDAVSSEIFFNLNRGGSIFKRALGAVALLGSRIPAVAGLKPLRESINLSDDYAFDSCETITLNQKTEETPMTVSVAEFEQMKKDLEALQAKNLELSQDRDKLAQLEKEIEKRDAALEILKRDNRNRAVEAKLSEIAIPAYRDFFKPLYASALDMPETAKFSLGEEKELPLTAVLDKLVEKLNADTKALFSEHSKASEGQDPEPEDSEVGAQVDKLADAYAAEHKVEYAEALVAVLSDPKNAELKAKYLA